MPTVSYICSSLHAYLCGPCCRTLSLLVIALVHSRLQSDPYSDFCLFDFCSFFVIVFFRLIVVVLCIGLLFGWIGNVSRV